VDSSDRISNQVIIHKMLKDLKNRGYEGFTARPWNYFEPDSTLWWLVPSKEWPSYKYGKLVLFRSEEGYRVGFNIEKGISEIAGQMLSLNGARKLCTKPDWAWNDLLVDLSNGKFENRLKEISDTAKKPLRISLQASNVTSEYDPHSKNLEGLETDHIMVLEYKNGKLEILQDELKGEMRKYSSISKISDLCGVFAEKELEWFWIDMFVVFDVENDKHDQITELALSFFEMYKDLFGVG